MDQLENTSTMPATATVLSRKSWTAYVGLIVRVTLLLGLCIVALYFRRDYWKVILLIVLVATPFVAYQIWLLRSYRLYCDEYGVWVYSGVLPWRRGVGGVKWRDLDEAQFVNSFWSWLSRSYVIRLTHRFTKDNEILLSHMAGGAQVVRQINERHRQYLQDVHIDQTAVSATPN